MSAGAVPAFAAPVEVSVPLSGGMLAIRSMNVGQIMRVLQASVEPVQLIMSLPADLLARLSSEEGPTHDDLVRLFEVLTEQPERLVEMVAIATGLKPDDVEVLPPDQFAFVFAVVVQVNADFFAKATPAFTAAGRVLRQLKFGPGAPASGPEPSTT